MVSVAAIHTSTDLACKVIVDLARNSEIIQPLRDEIVSVLGAGGWQKTSFYNMKLLDSCIKESQRMAPAGTRKIFALSHFMFLFNGADIMIAATSGYESKGSGASQAV